MKPPEIIRSSEWWEYKLSPLLGIGYATILSTGYEIYNYWKSLTLILISLAAGAAYVSIINDITDLKDDIAAGKKNRMQNLPAGYRWLLPIAGLLSGLFFEYAVYYPDTLSMIFYAIPWVLFSLYSFPPFRLKNQGIAGILCDAGGSHLFTSLLMVSSISFAMHRAVQPLWLLIVGSWAFCYGLRGILWHQYRDRENDLIAGLNTVAVRIPPEKFRRPEAIIFLAELLATGSLFLYLANPWVILAYLFYGLLCFLRYRFLKLAPVVILSGPKASVQILQLDYFQCFFPLTLLVCAAVQDKNNLLLLVFHLLLFPRTIRRIFTDLKKIYKTRN